MIGYLQELNGLSCELEPSMNQLTEQRTWIRVLVPAMVFQSVITGGGFATGREVVEYFGRFGSHAVACLCIAGIGFPVLFCVTAETARISSAFNYKTFGRAVLAKGWPVLETTFLAMAILVCAVVIAAFVATLESIVPVPGTIGTVIA